MYDPIYLISTEFDEVFTTDFLMIILYNDSIVLVKIKNGCW